MNALIRCTIHQDPEKMTEDEWHKAWGQTMYFLSVIHQVKFT